MGLPQVRHQWATIQFKGKNIVCTPRKKKKKKKEVCFQQIPYHIVIMQRLVFALCLGVFPHSLLSKLKGTIMQKDWKKKKKRKNKR